MEVEQSFKTRYQLIATYLNAAPAEEDMLVLECFVRMSNDVKKTYVTHVKKLNGDSVAYIRALDCYSADLLFQGAYMTIVKDDKNTYLALGTRTITSFGASPWCRYDVCINCDKLEISVNVKGHPQSHPWSTAGINLNDPSGCVPKDIEEEKKVSTFASRKFPGFFIDCHAPKDSNPQNNKYCSVIRKGNSQLGIIAKSECIVGTVSLTSFYVYTLYTNGEYRIVKLGGEEKSIVGNPTIKEKWFYFFPSKESRVINWKLVSNPKVSLMGSIDFPKPECIPEDKKPKDLQFDPEESKRKKKKRVSLFGG